MAATDAGSKGISQESAGRSGSSCVGVVSTRTCPYISSSGLRQLRLVVMRVAQQPRTRQSIWRR
jgi:hypothetical protein